MDPRTQMNADASLMEINIEKEVDEKELEIPSIVELEDMKEDDLLQLLVKQRKFHSSIKKEVLKNGHLYDRCDNIESMRIYRESIVPVLNKENLKYMMFPVLHPIMKQSPEVIHQYDPEVCPVNTDVRDINWELLGSMYQADVVMMDPPWNLSTEAPTRGVAIQYDMLTNLDIMEILSDALTQMQKKGGAVFIWTINSKFDACMSVMMSLGYKFSDNISWVKTSKLHNQRRFAKGHGFYCQHAKENCLFFVKGEVELSSRRQQIFFGERSGQSQKPVEMYHYIERLFPNKRYLEIFGRKNNLRKGWVTVGNELV